MGDLLGGDFSEFEREARRLAASLDDNSRAIEQMQRRGGASRGEVNRALAEQRIARERVGIDREPTARGQRTAAQRLRQTEADFDRAARQTESFARRTRNALDLMYGGRGPTRQLAGVDSIMRNVFRDIGGALRAQVSRQAGFQGYTPYQRPGFAADQAARLAERRLSQAGGMAPVIDTRAVTQGITTGIQRSFPSPDQFSRAVGQAVAPMFRQAGGRPNIPVGGAGGGGGYPPRGTLVGGAGGPPDDGGGARRTGAAYDRTNESIATMRQRLYSLSAAQSQASTAMRRHGALTTEFVQAAARGQTTLRELGFQVGSTTAKFGGWLAAGSAVFFALDAVRAIGRGAVDSASGVNQLERVMTNLDRSAAQSSFRELSAHFNLPIADVSNAAFEMGKVFRDQNDVMEATRAVLYSVRVGELSVADSSRYLIATINGFDLPASRMGTLFDQINQAQNRFGVQIRETEAGLAKASGTFKAAGGDVTTLIALLTTAQKVTGQSGEVVGTAIARAPHFIRMEQNVATLRDFGIRATAPIPEIFQKAFERARHLSGEELQLLAAAIGGPQYGARVFTGLLANGEKFREVMQQVNVEAARGSGEQELRTQLSAINEEIAAIGTSLEQFGSALESSGALTILEGMVKAMHGIVDVATAVVGVFAKLPDGITGALAVAGQLYVMLRAMRRLRTGDTIGDRLNLGPNAPARTFFNEDPRRYETRLYRQGLAQHHTTLQSDSERALSGQFRAQQEAMLVQARTQGQLAAIQRRRTAIMAGEQGALVQGLTRQQSLQLLQQEEASVIARRTTALTAVEEAEIRNVALQQELAQVEAAQAEAALRRNRLRGGQLAAARGVAIPGTLDVGTQTPPPYYPGGRRPPTTVADQFGIAYAQRDAAVGAPLAAARGDQFGVGRARAQALAVQQQSNALTRAGREFSQRSRLIGGAMRAVGSTATVVAGGLRAAPSGIRGAGAALARIGALLGPLDAALLGLFAGIEILHARSQSAEATDRAEQELEDLSRPRALAQRGGRRALLERARQLEEENEDAGLLGSIYEGAQTVARPLGDPLPYESDRQERLRRARDTIERLQQTRERQAAARQAHQPVPDQTLRQIDTAAQEDADAFGRGAITLAEFRNRMNRHLEEVGLSLGSSEQAQENQESRIRGMLLARGGGARLSPQRWAFALRSNGKQVEEQIAGLAALSDAGVASNRQINQLMQLLLVRGIQTRGGGSQKAREAYAEVGEQIAGAMQAQVDQVDQQLEGVDDPARRLQLRTRALARLRRSGLVAQARRMRGLLERRRDFAMERMRDAQADVAALEQEADQMQIGGALGETRGVFAPAEEGVQAARTRVGGARASARDARRQIHALNQVLRDYRQRQKAISDALKDEAHEEEQQLFDLQTQIRANRIAVGPARAAFIVRRAGEAVNRAIEQYGRNSSEALQAILDQQEAQNAYLDSLLTQIEGQNDLAAARAYAQNPDDRRGVARAELAGMQRTLAFYRAHPAQYGDRIPGIMAEIIRARADLSNIVEEEATDYLDALLEYRQSQTGSELRRARLEYRFARRIQREHPADSPAERLRQRARTNNARRQMLELESQEAIDRIQFQQDIGKLTTYQAIRQYQELLKTAKLSRDMRRDLRRKIYQLNNDLENENQFDLTVGSIRLPTVYDIRRTIGGEYGSDAWERYGKGGPTGRSAMSVQNNQTNNNVNLIFSGPVDAKHVIRELERHLGSSTRGSLRAAGEGVYTL